MNAPPARDRGSATLEIVILAPVLVVLLLFAIYAGRLSTAQGAVQEAARDASRRASIERTEAVGVARAHSSAQLTLSQQNLKCVSLNVNVTWVNATPGVPGRVTATVACNVRLSDLAVPGFSTANRTVTATFTSLIDPWRGQ